MTARPSALPAKQLGGVWSRLKVPALLLLVGLNVAFFAGSAALDLWQTFGPGTHFSGVITDHQQFIPTGEGEEQQNLITIDTGRGLLKFNVYDKTYADTSVGQHVSGALDSRTILGHSEGLRELTADGKEVFATQSLARAIGQTFIFLVVTVIGAMAVRLILNRNRPRAGGAPTTTPEQAHPV